MNHINYALISSLLVGILLIGCSSSRTFTETNSPEPDSDRITGGIADIAAESARKGDTITSEDAENRPISFAEQLLQGRVPGVIVTELASGGFSIRIRGKNSILGGSEPLFVVDGMQVMHNPRQGLSWLNIHDIEKIDVLKDVGSTALYGSRGANGVILITTKRGPEKR